MFSTNHFIPLRLASQNATFHISNMLRQHSLSLLCPEKSWIALPLSIAYPTTLIKPRGSKSTERGLHGKGHDGTNLTEITLGEIFRTFHNSMLCFDRWVYGDGLSHDVVSLRERCHLREGWLYRWQKLSIAHHPQSWWQYCSHALPCVAPSQARRKVPCGRAQEVELKQNYTQELESSCVILEDVVLVVGCLGISSIRRQGTQDPRVFVSNRFAMSERQKLWLLIVISFCASFTSLSVCKMIVANASDKIHAFSVKELYCIRGVLYRYI